MIYRPYCLTTAVKNQQKFKILYRFMKVSEKYGFGDRLSSTSGTNRLNPITTSTDVPGASSRKETLLHPGINSGIIIPKERLSAANWVFHYSVLNFVFIVLQVPYTAAIMSHERFDFLAIISVIDAVLKVLIALSLNRIGYDELIA